MARSRRRTRVWILFALGVLAVAAWGLGTFWGRRAPRTAPAPHVPVSADAFADSLAAHLPGAMLELGVGKTCIDSLPPKGTSTARIQRARIRVPCDLPLTVCNLEIARLATHLGGRVFRAEGDRGQTQLAMQLGAEERVTWMLDLVADGSLVRRTGKIALIIGDLECGEEELARAFCALRQTVTLAVLPDSDPCGSVAAAAQEAGCDLLLHLPMEPVDFPRRDPGPGAILVRDSDEAIRRKIRDALKRVGVPVQGVCNQMGSRATGDARVMRAVMDETKRRGLFFVDSRTWSYSLAYDTARARGVKAARNRMFVDESADRELVADRLFELSYIAAQEGQAVGIAKASRQTLEVLLDVLPQIEKRGFQFVGVSQIVQ